MFEQLGGTLAFMQGVEPFAGRELQATEERVGWVFQAGRIDLELLALQDVGRAKVRISVLSR